MYNYDPLNTKTITTHKHYNSITNKNNNIIEDQTHSLHKTTFSNINENLYLE